MRQAIVTKYDNGYVWNDKDDHDQYSIYDLDSDERLAGPFKSWAEADEEFTGIKRQPINIFASHPLRVKRGPQ